MVCNGCDSYGRGAHDDKACAEDLLFTDRISQSAQRRFEKDEWREHDGENDADGTPVKADRLVEVYGRVNDHPSIEELQEELDEEDIFHVSICPDCCKALPKRSVLVFWLFDVAKPKENKEQDGKEQDAGNCVDVAVKIVFEDP